MNEQNLIADRDAAAQPSGAEAASADAAPSAPSYGARLASERQNAGLGITDVAASLRLHPNQVRAIEQEDLARLPAPAYVRGFIRSYARLLNIDPAPLLADLNSKLAPAREAVADGTASDYSAARSEPMVRHWAIGIVLVILIALGIVGWRAAQQRPPEPPLDTAVVPAATVTAPAAAPQTLAPLADGAKLAEKDSVAPAAATEPVPAPADAAEPTVKASVAANEVPPTLLLRFNGASWAEVTDRSGKILLSQLSSAGAEHVLDGELPLTVVIGDANFTAVEVRGAPFNLLPFTRNNVARFTVK